MTKDLVTYLGFDGDCEAAFKFYASVLNGEILMMLRYADGPPEMPKTPEIANKIMHVRMQIGDRVLMGGDAPTSCYQKPQGFNVNIMVETPAEADRIYAALAGC